MIRIATPMPAAASHGEAAGRAAGCPAGAVPRDRAAVAAAGGTAALAGAVAAAVAGIAVAGTALGGSGAGISPAALVSLLIVPWRSVRG